MTGLTIMLKGKDEVIKYPNIISDNPLVSVCVVTYKHEFFIKDCLDCILMQQTDSTFEILLGEDDSPDNTRKICIEYAKKYPEKIRLFLHDRVNNIKINGNPTGRFNFLYNLSTARGKYVAICEGDDYWTDPYKLQKQLDFLEANKDFVICHHNMQVIYEDGRETHLSNPPDQKEISTIEDLARGNFIYTSSCVFRNGLIKELPDWFASAPVGDYVLHMLNAEHGKIKFLPDVMGVYRIHKNGLWENKDNIFRIERWVELLDLMKNQFSPHIRNIFFEVQRNYYLQLINHYADNHEKCSYYSKRLLDLKPFTLVELRNQIQVLQDKNKSILNSGIYRLGAFLLKPYSFLKRILHA